MRTARARAPSPGPPPPPQPAEGRGCPWCGRSASPASTLQHSCRCSLTLKQAAWSHLEAVNRPTRGARRHRRAARRAARVHLTCGARVCRCFETFSSRVRLPVSNSHTIVATDSETPWAAAGRCATLYRSWQGSELGGEATGAPRNEHDAALVAQWLSTSVPATRSNSCTGQPRRRMRGRVAPLVALALSASLCNRARAQNGEPCSTQSDCNVGWYCDGGMICYPCTYRHWAAAVSFARARARAQCTARVQHLHAHTARTRTPPRATCRTKPRYITPVICDALGGSCCTPDFLTQCTDNPNGCTTPAPTPPAPGPGGPGAAPEQGGEAGPLLADQSLPPAAARGLGPRAREQRCAPPFLAAGGLQLP